MKRTLTLLPLLIALQGSAQLDSAAERSALYSFTAGTLLTPGEIEVKLFDNLYTQTHFFNENLQRTALGQRQTYFTGTLETAVGLSQRVNAGIDLWFQSVHFSEMGVSPFSVLRFSNDSVSQTALTYIAPKVKWRPAKKLPNLSLQFSLFVPLKADMEGTRSGRPYLAFDGSIFHIRAFYDHILSSNWQLFAEAGAMLLADRNFEIPDSNLSFPLKGILKYFPKYWWNVYILTEITPTIGGSFYIQSGAGTTLSISEHIQLELLATKFWWGRLAGAGGKVTLPSISLL